MNYRGAKAAGLVSSSSVSFGSTNSGVCVSDTDSGSASAGASLLPPSSGLVPERALGKSQYPSTVDPKMKAPVSPQKLTHHGTETMGSSDMVIDSDCSQNCSLFSTPVTPEKLVGQATVSTSSSDVMKESTDSRRRSLSPEVSSSSRRLCSTLFKLNSLTPGLPAPTGYEVTDSFPGLTEGGCYIVYENVEKTVSKFSELFPGIVFDCYYTIQPYIASVKPEAWSVLDSFLPISGPIVAKDLGLLMSYLVFAFDLRDIRLPGLTSCVIEGYNFLHFDSSSMSPVLDVIARLLTYDGFVGSGKVGGVDPINMINVAATVGATTIAANDASLSYRDTLRALVPVTTILNEEEMKIITRERSARFLQNNEVSNGHKLMAAWREIIRYDLSVVANIQGTELRTLVLGATEREYRNYSSNPFVYFQLANREGKDTTRMITNFLRKVRANKVNKVNRTANGIKTTKRAYNHVKSIDQMLHEFRMTCKIPARFLLWDETQKLFGEGVVDDSLSPPVEEPDLGIFSRFFDSMTRKCYSVGSAVHEGYVWLVPTAIKDNPDQCTFDQIVFEDVGYNFTKHDWYKIFRSTNAIVGYGYMCLPWELAFPGIVEQPGYRYRVSGKYSLLGYEGPSNGYKHRTEAWKTLLTSTLIDLKDMSLGVEIVSRAGPMALIKIYRMQRNDFAVRRLGLPSDLKSVQLLNIRQSTNNHTGELNMGNLVYFPVRVNEFQDTLNYAIDIAKESLSFRNVMVFIRRRCSGMSLVTKELSNTWTVDRALIGEMAEVVYLVAVLRLMLYEKFEKKIKDATFNPCINFFQRMWHKALQPLKHVFSFFASHQDIEKILVKGVDEQIWQEAKSKCAEVRKKVSKRIYAGEDPEKMLDESYNYDECVDEEGNTACSFCEQLTVCMGKQKLLCDRDKPENFYHEFALSSEELKKFREELANTETDPPGLKILKEKALTRLPPAAFSESARVQYICGPPGTGKSHIIRGLATSEDIVVAPFARLKEDYTDFIHPVTQKRTTLKFYTQHNAFEAMNHTRVFVDEYTAMPYECLAVIVHRCAATEVVLVGDDKQTGIIHDIEGIAINQKIDVNLVRQHQLIKNFRNPCDAVAVLNTLYGYQMEATNTIYGYVFDRLENFKNYQNLTPIFFRHASAAQYGYKQGSIDKLTVRSNQGATYDNVVLIVTNDDVKLFNMPSMAIVALSRHRLKCVILSEDGNAAIFSGMVASAIPRGHQPKSPEDDGYDAKNNGDDHGGGNGSGGNGGDNGSGGGGPGAPPNKPNNGGGGASSSGSSTAPPNQQDSDPKDSAEEKPTKGNVGSEATGQAQGPPKSTNGEPSGQKEGGERKGSAHEDPDHEDHTKGTKGTGDDSDDDGNDDPGASGVNKGSTRREVPTNPVVIQENPVRTMVLYRPTTYRTCESSDSDSDMPDLEEVDDDQQQERKQHTESLFSTMIGSFQDFSVLYFLKCLIFGDETVQNSETDSESNASNMLSGVMNLINDFNFRLYMQILLFGESSDIEEQQVEEVTPDVPQETSTASNKQFILKRLWKQYLHVGNENYFYIDPVSQEEEVIEETRPKRRLQKKTGLAGTSKPAGRVLVHGDPPTDLIQVASEIRKTSSTKTVVESIGSGSTSLQEQQGTLVGYHASRVSSSGFNIPANGCLIESMCELTGEDRVRTWAKFMAALGTDMHEKLDRGGLSIQDLEKYCNFHNVKVRVYRDGDDDGSFIVCGSKGNFLGCLKFIGPPDAGHFEFGSKAEYILGRSPSVITTTGDETNLSIAPRTVSSVSLPLSNEPLLPTPPHLQKIKDQLKAGKKEIYIPFKSRQRMKHLEPLQEGVEKEEVKEPVCPLEVVTSVPNVGANIKTHATVASHETALQSEVVQPSIVSSVSSAASKEIVSAENPSPKQQQSSTDPTTETITTQSGVFTQGGVISGSQTHEETTANPTCGVIHETSGSSNIPKAPEKCVKGIPWSERKKLLIQGIVRPSPCSRPPYGFVKDVPWKERSFKQLDCSLSRTEAVNILQQMFQDFSLNTILSETTALQKLLKGPMTFTCRIYCAAKLRWCQWFIQHYTATVFGLPSSKSVKGKGPSDGPDSGSAGKSSGTRRGSDDKRSSSTSSTKSQSSTKGQRSRSTAALHGTFSRHLPNWIGGSEKINTPLPQLDVVEPRKVLVEPLANASEHFLEMARLFTNPIKVTDYLVEQKLLPEEPLFPLEQSPYDAYRMLYEDFATSKENSLMLTNEESLNYFDPNFGTGLFDTTKLDNVNQRGHPKKNKQIAWSILAVAPGVTYFKNNTVQSLACLQARYLTKLLVTKFDHEGIKKANEMADLFFFEHMHENFDVFNEQDIWTTTLESEHAMKVKNYEAQVQYDIGGETDVRFTMKDIFKPIKTKIDLYKAGQGISAWSKDAQTIFQTAFRVINKHFINCLLPHVVYDNGIDEVTLMNRVNALFSQLPSVCVNGVIDATACDSGQNRFTQKLERRILERMGIQEWFLDWYYSFREEYVLKGYGVTAKIKDIKTSGEPATLLNNTTLMAIIMNYLIRGEGPCVLVIKGDDGLKRQANIVYDEGLKESLKTYLKMDFKVDIDVPITFCGYFLYKRYLVPDLIRKVFKILGHKFRDYEHFQEYQESLRDWILHVNKIGVSDICYLSATAYGLNTDYCYEMFHAVVSLSHIRRQQFEEFFTLREFDWGEDMGAGERWSEKAPWYTGSN